MTGFTVESSNTGFLQESGQSHEGAVPKDVLTKNPACAGFIIVSQ